MADQDGVAGAKTFTVQPGDQFAIENFGAFGVGGAPANPAELDTLAFTDFGLIASNLILRQSGADVLITFDGDNNATTVTLQDTAIEQLGNIAGAGNFQFFGEVAVTDSLDVWGAGENGDRIHRRGTVTFLNALDNTVVGFGDSDDVINGLAGNDTLNGLARNDTLRGGDGNDALIGGLGNDRLQGDAGNDKVSGGTGDDVLDGGDGDDVLVGGKGSDIYAVDSPGDTIVEDIQNSRGGGWHDQVLSSISFSLASHARVEDLTLTGSDNLDGTGNKQNNVIAGNLGNNSLEGQAGDDTLIGSLGFDDLDGGAGFDTVVFEGDSASAQIYALNGQLFVRDFMGFTDGLTGIEALQFDDGLFFFPSKIADTNGDANIAAENAADGAPVGIVALATVPGDGEIVYSLTEGDGAFAIDSKTGVVTVAHGEFLDFEANETRTITVRATAPGGLFSEQNFTVAIQDQADGALSRIDLQEVGKARGFTILGIDPLDLTGLSVGAAGDVNGDGYDDVVVGAPAARTSEFESNGKAYVIFGNPGGSQDIDLAALTPDQGFALSGPSGDPTQGSEFGRSVSNAGDVNGDGRDDLIVGAFAASPYDRTNAGVSYVIYGQAGGSGNLDLGTLAPSQGFKISGADAFDYSGVVVSDAGDVNGDGIDDLALGTNTGKAYVIYGQPGEASDIDLADLPPDRGVTLAGGYTISAAGDINGDGIDDVIVGNRYASPLGRDGAGESYAVYGQAGGIGDIDLGALTTAQGFKLFGSTGGENSGYAVSAADDVDGDGVDDLLIGAIGPESGGAYVIFGKAGGSGDLDLGALTGAQGFRILGVPQGDQRDISVSNAGDFNGDGIGDIIVGAAAADRPGHEDAGELYLIYGKQGGSGDIDLADLAPDRGFTITGAAAGDSSGISVSGAGDINGDGFDDLIIGAALAGQMPNPATGEVYVVYGGDFTGSVARPATAADHGASNQRSLHLADVLHIGAGDEDIITRDSGDGGNAPGTGAPAGHAPFVAGNVKGAFDEDIVVASHG